MMRTYFIFMFIAYVGVSFGQFTGGNKDGYDSQLSLNSVSIYAGGAGDGYASNQLINPNSIYTGGSEDGYASSSFTPGISIYSGGTKDGYALGEKIFSFIWTGAVNENWNNAGNWKTAVIPNINNNVVIPAQVPNYPVLANGLMSIGQNPNGGLFLCKQIRIKQGAQMTYTASAFLENYGLMDIRGTVFGNNYAANAFLIKSGGSLQIINQGSLNF